MVSPAASTFREKVEFVMSGSVQIAFSYANDSPRSGIRVESKAKVNFLSSFSALATVLGFFSSPERAVASTRAPAYPELFFLKLPGVKGNFRGGHRFEVVGFFF
jgi:hypothetical protein